MQNESLYKFDCENLLFKCFAKVVRRKKKQKLKRNNVRPGIGDQDATRELGTVHQLRVAPARSKRKGVQRARATLCGEGLRAANSAVRRYIMEVSYPHPVTGWIWKCPFLPQL